uniref:hypothetical protein n=1 Tax=Pseudomonas aeruginosa TaxID=287 RepID=UPI003892A22D
SDNIKASWLEDGQFIARTMNPEDIERLDRPSYNQVMADITTSFTILIGIFFPSVTGKFPSFFPLATKQTLLCVFSSRAEPFLVKVRL